MLLVHLLFLPPALSLPFCVFNEQWIIENLLFARHWSRNMEAQRMYSSINWCTQDIVILWWRRIFYVCHLLIHLVMFLNSLTLVPNWHEYSADVKTPMLVAWKRLCSFKHLCKLITLEIQLFGFQFSHSLLYWQSVHSTRYEVLPSRCLLNR